MVNKLKLLSFIFKFRLSDSEIDEEIFHYVVSYTDFISYLKSSHKLKFLKHFFEKDCPIKFVSTDEDSRLDYRSCVYPLLYYFLYSLFDGDTVFNDLISVTLRLKTLSEATSDKINDYIYFNDTQPFSLGYYAFTSEEGLRLAMFSPNLCLSEHLLKSGDWKEYNFIPEKRQ